MFFHRKKAHTASADGRDEQRRVALDRLARLAAHDAGRDAGPADTRPRAADAALRTALEAEIAAAVDRLGRAPSGG